MDVIIFDAGLISLNYCLSILRILNALLTHITGISPGGCFRKIVYNQSETRSLYKWCTSGHHMNAIAYFAGHIHFSYVTAEKFEWCNATQSPDHCCLVSNLCTAKWAKSPCLTKRVVAFHWRCLKQVHVFLWRTMLYLKYTYIFSNCNLKTQCIFSTLGEFAGKCRCGSYYIWREIIAWYNITFESIMFEVWCIPEDLKTFLKYIYMYRHS